MDTAIRLLQAGRFDDLVAWLHDPQGPEGDELLNVLRVPPIRQAFLRRNPEPRTVLRVQAAVADTIRGTRRLDATLVQLTSRLRTAWPDVSWDSVRDAVLSLQEGSPQLRSDYDYIFELHTLFWDDLSQEQLAWLYHFCKGPDRDVIVCHPRADREFWHAVLQRKSPDRREVLTHAAHRSSIARTDPELREILLESNRLDVYLGFVRNTNDPKELEELIGRFAAEEAPFYVWRLLEAVPVDQRRTLGNAVMRQLQHRSPDIRLSTQLVLLGTPVAGLPGYSRPPSARPASSAQRRA